MSDAETDGTGDVIWGLRDYGIFVPMTDKFYQTLKFARTDLESFKSGNYVPQQDYVDSRSYVAPILKHFIAQGGNPYILDVGGYIGRFSIESALAVREMGLDCPIYCFEPGGTRDLLRRNFALNELEDYIQHVNSAVSNSSEPVSFAIPGDAMISSRIASDPATQRWVENGTWGQTTVPCTRLQTFISERNLLGRPFICKIDTEGHEVKVIDGLEQSQRASVPHALVIEFWPKACEELLDGRPFEEALFEQYYVLDILSSLYPRGYETLSDLEGVIARLEDKEAANLDLLLISRTTPGAEALVDSLKP